VVGAIRNQWHCSLVWESVSTTKVSALEWDSFRMSLLELTHWENRSVAEAWSFTQRQLRLETSIFTSYRNSKAHQLMTSI